MKLNLGCGNNVLSGYVNIDLFFNHPKIQKMDLSDLSMYTTDSVEEISSVHSLEHLPIKKIIPTLQEWKRVLKPGGIIRVVVPDAEKCFLKWLKDPDPFGWWACTLWGLQTDEGQFHKFGFRRDTIKHLAEQSGLKLVKVSPGYSHGGPDLLIELTK